VALDHPDDYLLVRRKYEETLRLLESHQPELIDELGPFWGRFEQEYTRRAGEAYDQLYRDVTARLREKQYREAHEAIDHYPEMFRHSSYWTDQAPGLRKLIDETLEAEAEKAYRAGFDAALKRIEDRAIELSERLVANDFVGARNLVEDELADLLKQPGFVEWFTGAPSAEAYRWINIEESAFEDGQFVLNEIPALLDESNRDAAQTLVDEYREDYGSLSTIWAPPLLEDMDSVLKGLPIPSRSGEPDAEPGATPFVHWSISGSGTFRSENNTSFMTGPIGHWAPRMYPDYTLTFELYLEEGTLRWVAHRGGVTTMRLATDPPQPGLAIDPPHTPGLTLNKWHTVTVRFRNGRCDVGLDGGDLFRRPTPAGTPDAGPAGFYCEPNSRCRIRNVTITE
jgi:hypothetical protein